jgi:hypothetical protein
MITRTLIVFTIFALFISCKQINKETHNQNIGENFQEFDKQFHTDSTFQMSRIVFPLTGKYIDGFKKQNWSKKNWQLMHVAVSEKISDKNYEQKTTISDTLITQKIWIKNSGFKFERKFKKIKGKWFLTYCEDINL